MTEVVNTAVADRPARAIAASVWLPAVIPIMAYPFLTAALFGTTKIIAETGSALWVLWAVMLCGVVFAIPALAARGLIAISKSTAAGAPTVRRILFLAFAASPLYLLFGYGSRVVSAAVWHGWWWAFWLIAAGVMWKAGEATEARSAKAPAFQIPAQLRIVHRTAAAGLVLTFLALHLTNHMTAAWSLETQGAVMAAFRHIYRAPVIEPVMLAFFALAAVTGLALMIRHTRGPSDKFRVLQMATGVYLAFFIVKHLLAIFMWRAAGKETDWAYAAGGGPAGMFSSESYTGVFLYYVLVIFFVGIHVAMGVRMVLLTRGMDRPKAARVAYGIIGVGGAMTVVITAALLGVRLGA